MLGAKMPDPNARQVGGNHYIANYQHWDLVADTGMGYFEAQITRYVSRWRRKNGLEDVEKARHYFEKLISLHRERRIPMPPLSTHANWHSAWRRFKYENELSDVEQQIFIGLLSYVTLEQLESLHDHFAIVRGMAERHQQINVRPLK